MFVLRERLKPASDLLAPAVTTTCIILSSNKIHNRHVLVLANVGPFAKIVTKMEKERRCVYDSM